MEAKQNGRTGNGGEELEGERPNVFESEPFVVILLDELIQRLAQLFAHNCHMLVAMMPKLECRVQPETQPAKKKANAEV